MSPGQPGSPPPETEKPKARKVGQYGWTFDNDADPSVFYLEIPLGAIASDPTINGITFMLGFFEQCKLEAVAQVKRKRALLAQNVNGKIILPGQMPMKVH